MKALLPLLAVLALASCKKEVSEAEYDKKRVEIESAAYSVGWDEYSLRWEKEAGPIAALTEELRDGKTELDRAINDKNSPITIEEAKRIADAQRKSGASAAEKSRKEHQEWVDGMEEETKQLREKIDRDSAAEIRKFGEHLLNREK